MTRVEKNLQKNEYEFDLNQSRTSHIDQGRINWNALPVKVKTGFLETRNERRIAAASLSAFATLAGLSTVGAAIGFTASPLVVIGVTAGLAFLTVASIAAAIVLLCLKQSRNDPYYLSGLRMELKQELKINAQSGFETIRNKYSKEIISDAEINLLIPSDLKQLDYPSFQRKHGNSVIDILNQENHAALRTKCLEYFQENLSFHQIAQQPETVKFHLSQNEWASEAALHEANRIMSAKGTYSQFVERNGNDAINYLDKQHPAYGYFRETYLNLPLATQQKLGHQGILQITQEEITQRLLQKWNNMPIHAIANDPDFKTGVGVAFSPELFSLKALEETRSIPIFEIARQMPILFSSGIIKYNDLSLKYGIAEKVSNELNALKSIEELMQLPDVLFTGGLINNLQFTVMKFVKAFVQSHTASYLENQWVGSDSRIKAKIDEYQLMPEYLASELKKLKLITMLVNRLIKNR